MSLSQSQQGAALLWPHSLSNSVPSLSLDLLAGPALAQSTVQSQCHWHQAPKPSRKPFSIFLLILTVTLTDTVTVTVSTSMTVSQWPVGEWQFRLYKLIEFHNSNNNKFLCLVILIGLGPSPTMVNALFAFRLINIIQYIGLYRANIKLLV